MEHRSLTRGRQSDGRWSDGTRASDQSPPDSHPTPTLSVLGRKRAGGHADGATSPRQRRGSTQAHVRGPSSAGPSAGGTDAMAREAPTSPEATRSLLPPDADPFARLESLTHELNDLKNLLPLLIASSTQPRAIAKVLARFLHKRPTTTAHPSPSGAASSPATSFSSAASPLGVEQHGDWRYQMPNLEATSSNPASQYTPSATAPSHHEDAMSTVSAVDRTNQEQEWQGREGHRRSYIEVFGTLGRSGTNGEDNYKTSTPDQTHMDFRVQHHLISPLWLADHEIENSEERWLTSAFHRMRDRSRSQILRGVPPEAVFGLPYPALLFSPRREVPSMDDALTISDWIARLLEQYPQHHQDLPTRVGSWVLMTAQFQASTDDCSNRAIRADGNRSGR